MVMERRYFLGAALASCLTSYGRSGSAATPTSVELEATDLMLDGDPRIARRALVLVPKHVRPGTRLPVLLLLHGLGETASEILGIHAWGERYGLVSSYERLSRPPLQRTLERQRYLTDERLEELRTSLVARPFRGLVLVCPVTPNPHRAGPAQAVLDRYADWIESTLLPAVRRRAPIAEGVFAAGIDGCSLGGYVGLEVFLRKPGLFGSVGSVQGAFGVAAANQYAERLAATVDRMGPRAIHLETSSWDPYLEANRAFSRRLTALGVPHELRIAPGPHDQPWLREVGTLEMLLWHDRQLQPHP